MDLKLKVMKRLRLQQQQQQQGGGGGGEGSGLAGTPGRQAGSSGPSPRALQPATAFAAAATAHIRGGGGPSPNTCVLGYLCYIRPTHEVFLLLHCPHPMLLPWMQRHPLMQQLHALQPAVSGGATATWSPLQPPPPSLPTLLPVLHLSPHEVVASPRYRAWMRQLPGLQVHMGMHTFVA